MAASRLRSFAVAVLVVACATGVSACGGTKQLGGTPSSVVSSGIKFADCMRSHGVQNFPDPGSGGGVQITPGSGVNPQSPAFQAAQGSCAKLMPGGGPGRGQGSEQRRLAMVKLSECMSAHGLTTFPDPTTSAPTSPPSGGIAFGTPGAFLSIPASMMQSPAFKQAASQCGLPGGGGKPPKGAQLSGAP